MKFIRNLLSFDHHPVFVGLVDAVRCFGLFVLLLTANQRVYSEVIISNISAYLSLGFGLALFAFVCGIKATNHIATRCYMFPVRRLRWSLLGGALATLGLYVAVGVQGDWSLRALSLELIITLPLGLVFGDRCLSSRDPLGIAKLLRRQENVQAHLRLKGYTYHKP